MSDQNEELIREIATKHGIAVSRDDPILILQTINNRLLMDSAKAQQVQLDQYKEELEALTLRWSNDAKGKAERILDASLLAAKDAMSQLMEEGAKSSARLVAAEIELALAPIKDAHRIAMLNVMASCITMLAAAIALWATLH